MERMSDKDGNPAVSCPTNVSFSGAVLWNQQLYMIPVTGKITPTAELLAQIMCCTGRGGNYKY